MQFKAYKTTRGVAVRFTRISLRLKRAFILACQAGQVERATQLHGRIARLILTLDEANLRSNGVTPRTRVFDFEIARKQAMQLNAADFN